MLKIIMTLSILVTAGCTSTGNMGLMAKSSADPASILRNGRAFRDLGPAQGKACRMLFLGVAPLGNADIQKAVDRALLASGGDALINIATSNSHYGVLPIYNLFSFNCTEVKGSAVKFL